MKINVLGVEYTIIEADVNDYPLLKKYESYCDSTAKKIVIKEEFEGAECENIEILKENILKHEIIHAFLNESGLGDQCKWHCEEMVDWLAVQFDKISNVFEKI